MSYSTLKKPSFPAVFRRFSSVATFFSLLVLLQSAGFGTWNKVAQFPATVNASFFFNEQRGFIAIDGTNGIKRTSDGGSTWLDCTIPTGFAGFFTDIFMKDSLNGWVSIEEPANNFAHGLWSTTDGGVSWQANTTIAGFVSSVYQTSSGLIIGDRYTQNKLSLSTDGGATFTRLGTDSYTGINFTDDLHGVATIYKGTALYTNDGGLTWKPTSVLTEEAWGIYAQKGSSNFVVVGEKISTDPSSQENIYASSDYGATWQTIGVISRRTTGHVAGVGSVIYAQSQTPWQVPANQPGMIRSTDGGKTWVPVGGPSNFRDTRFSVMGCQGSIVYAFDEAGGVWKTTDGGDGLIQESPTSATISSGQIALSASYCSKDFGSITYADLSCDSIRIESIGFSDSTSSVVTTGALSFTKYPKLPQSLGPDTWDSIVLKWEPKKLPPKAFSSVTHIKLHGSVHNGALVFDTTLAVGIETFAPQPDSRPDSIVLPPQKIGGQICTTFVLKNTAPIGSPPFILESAAFSKNDTSYKIISSLPASVAAQDSLILQICFNPSDSSRHLDSLILKTDCFSFAISLDARGLPVAGVRSSAVSNSFSLRPNPAQNELDIQLQQEAGQKIQIEIFDALGKKVFSEERNLIDGMNTIHIDTRNLSAGIYLLRAGETAQKFVKE